MHGDLGPQPRAAARVGFGSCDGARLVAGVSGMMRVGPRWCTASMRRSAATVWHRWLAL